MMLRCVLLLYRFAPQKVLFLLIFLAIVRPLRILVLHFQPFFHRQLRQAPEEKHQFPTNVRRGVGTSAKRRHAGEAHSIFDDPEKLAVGKLLRFRQRRSGGFGYKPLPYIVSPLPSLPWQVAQ